MKKAQQQLDKILKSAHKRIQDEVSGLIGVSFVLADSERQFISKEDAFEQLSGKQVVARMDITGDIQGHGCLLLAVKDAIRLGGTFLMIPDNALDDMISAEKYDADTEDSYGEIANIIAGSYTKVFEEMYPEGCRFIRKEQEVIVPVKVNISSDEPVPEQLYYQVVTGITLAGRQLGNLVMLLPAATFGLEQDEPAVESDDPVASRKPVSGVTAKRPDGGMPESSSASDPQVMTEKGPAFDVKKHQKQVDALLEACSQKIGAEIGALLGADVTFGDLDNRLVSKENYFLDEAAGKQVLAHMDVVGESAGKSYLFVSLKDAIYLGGSLIMLPPGEIERAVMDEEFGNDIEDAYGEIANIVSGAYTSVFEEQYVKKIRFVKTGLERVLPLKVETESDLPLPNQFYYMSSSSLHVGGKAMGKVQMLFPAPLLQLDGFLQQEGEAVVKQTPPEKMVSTAGRVENISLRAVDVLVVSDDAREAEKITEVVAQLHLVAQVLSFKENVTDCLPGEVKAVFLVMSSVNENGFAVAIKIKAACSLPLIAVGQEWTRTKVITAVKYGIEDILLSPATHEDIAEKINTYSFKLAA
jgi:chemotaxis protein CheY-P-specific phosphatase CheC